MRPQEIPVLGEILLTKQIEGHEIVLCDAGCQDHRMACLQISGSGLVARVSEAISVAVASRCSS